jgi:hypothetical protein
MQFSELKSEVFRRLNENETSPTFWAEADVEESLNEGLEELSDASEWYEEYFVISLLTNLQYYDLRVLLPDTFLAPKRFFNQTTNQWLSPVALRELDYHGTRQWETVTGEPQRTLLRGLWWLGFWPKQPSDSGKVKFYYSAIPPRMTEDTDEPGFPQEYHKYLIEYALYDLLAQDGETKKALVHWQTYLEGERLLRASVGSRIATDRSANV